MKPSSVLWFGLLFLISTTAGATTRRVPQDYLTIQAAVNASNPGDVVLVAAGDYHDVVHRPGNGDTTLCAVIMKSGITLRGAGAGQTFIIADSLGRGIHCQGVTGVTIRDLTVKRAFAPVHGAGIYIKENSSVSLINCELTHNYDGGVIWNSGSTGSMSFCSVTSNASKQGGGIAIEAASNVTLTSCTVTGNVAPVAGGIYIQALSVARIDGCTISGNALNAPNGAGGGMVITNAQLTMTNSTINNNHGDGSGGGVTIFDSSVVTMTNCLVQGNSTVADYGPGGGIYMDFSTLTLTGCTITRNTIAGPSSDGAGVYTFFATDLAISQCTIAANANNGQPSAAGGIGCFYASPTVDKSIIAFNNPGKAITCTDPSDNPIVSCSDLFGNAGGDQICGTDAGHNFSLDPLFCDLAHDNYRIQYPNSPCVPGRHPDGPRACGGSRIGAQDPGCNPAGAEDAEAGQGVTRLIGNAPNPVHPTTLIRFELARPEIVALTIYDVAGRQIRSLTRQPFPAGQSEVRWDGRDADGRDVPSGVYFYRLRVGALEQTRHLILAR